MTDIIKHYLTPAHTLEEGDQVIIYDDECKILYLEDQTDNIYVRVENLGTGPDEFNLDPDDEFWIWSI